MATWREVVSFVRRAYPVVRDAGEELRVRVYFGDEQERAQIVVLAHEILDGEWVQIATPFARVADVDLLRVLEEAGNTTVVGSIVIMREYVVLRHSVPLANLDLNELVEPLELVAGSGDQLEQKFVGGDDF